MLPEHNSIAWILWHIARGEDWTVQSILLQREQLLTRDNWAEQMGVAEPGFGGGMPRSEMVALSERIDLGALRGYYDAVAATTCAFARDVDFDTLDDPFDIDSRLDAAPGGVGPSVPMRQMMLRWNTPRVWIDVMTVVDVSFHVEEAEHVGHLLMPEREFL